MSVEKPLGEVLFTLVIKQVPWNEVLQSSQEVSQYIYLYLSYIPYRLLSESENYLSQEAKANAPQLLGTQRHSITTPGMQFGSSLKQVDCFFVVFFPSLFSASS